MTTSNKVQEHDLNGLAESFYDEGSFEKLAAGLDSEADTEICQARGITNQEWRESIKQASEVAQTLEEAVQALESDEAARLENLQTHDKPASQP